MKKKIVILGLVFIIMIGCLVSCGVPQEKLDKIGTTYEEIGTLYVKVAEDYQAAGRFEDEAFAKSYSDWGTAISAFGTQIADTLAELKEDEVDTLQKDLDAVFAQLQEAESLVAAG